MIDFKVLKEEQMELNKAGMPDVVHKEDGRWWFWDETWSERIGPFKYKSDALRAARKYCEEVLGWEKDDNVS